jgi:hypothetical protein
MAATQNWAVRPNKYNNDQELYDVIRQVIPINGTHNVLCLPGYSFRWEEALVKQNTLRDWQFYGLQPDKQGREKLTEHAYTLNHEYKQQGISTRFHPHALTPGNKLELQTYVKYTDRVYSVIYADWMGGWYDVSRDTMETIFRRRLLANKSVLIFTVQLKCARSEGRTKGYEKLMVYYNSNVQQLCPAKIANTVPADYKAAAQSVDTILATAGKSRGYNLTLGHIGHYKGDRKKQDMFTFTYACERHIVPSTPSIIQ